MKWKKTLQLVLWSVLGLGTCTLLVAAMEKKDSKQCTAIDIQIRGAQNHVFVNKNDVLAVIQKNGGNKNEVIDEINLKNIETQLEKNAWVKNAELFFDNNQVLHATIEEREPLARIFTIGGNSFYIDSSCKRLPLSDELSARVPMFTSFPSDKKILSKPDSAVLIDVKKIAQYIQQDSFLAAQVAQVDITQQRTYEIIPVVGDQLIRLGNADSLDEKFNKLKIFYKQVWAKAGFEKYETIDLQFHDQVVAVKRGMGNTAIDTTRAMQEFASNVSAMQAVMNDTTFAVAIPKSAAVKDSVQQQTNTTAKKPVVTNKKPAVQTKKTVKPAATKKQPKAVLKKP